MHTNHITIKTTYLEVLGHRFPHLPSPSSELQDLSSAWHSPSPVPATAEPAHSSRNTAATSTAIFCSDTLTVFCIISSHSQSTFLTKALHSRYVRILSNQWIWTEQPKLWMNNMGYNKSAYIIQGGFLLCQLVPWFCTSRWLRGANKFCLWNGMPDSQ